MQGETELKQRHKKTAITVVLLTVILTSVATNNKYLAEPRNRNPNSSPEQSTFTGSKETYLAESEHIFLDSFETDSGNWVYYGKAGLEAGSLILTKNETFVFGAVKSKLSLGENWRVSFRYKIGGGSGGDGIAFLFGVHSLEVFPLGGYLGFEPNESEYGVVFDSFYNPELRDPVENYIALVEKGIEQKLAIYETVKTEDNLWHQVTITTVKGNIQIDLDGKDIISKKINYDSKYDGFGFSASTGKYSNIHMIDDFIFLRMDPRD